MSLEEYKAAVASGEQFPWNPVVRIPQGAMVELTINKKPVEFYGINVEEHLFGSFELVDEQLVKVRLRAKSMVYLDLQYLLASSDKKSWMPMMSYFFPMLRESRITLSANGSSTDAIVPVMTWFEQARMIKQ